MHEKDPFPWQSRLAEELCATNAWPDVLDLPTGSGKTACIDIALFHWLVSASRGSPSKAARRIAFVVDRRIIVDEATERARKIGKAIADATAGVLGEARRVLAESAGDATIGVFALRGGVARERNLVRDPLRVTVVLSTVDQVGSRLLFRGYGVRGGMRSLHAGIFGTDTLLLLDEAHIAEPFKQTLEGVVREQARAEAGTLGPKPLRWAQLSATPSEEQRQARVFSLSEEDRLHPVLRPRLVASKPMQLVEVAKREDLPAKLVDLVKAELALPRLSTEEEPRIGIVVNRVATARALYDALRKGFKDTAEVELLIGRVRPLDRDRKLFALTPKLKSSDQPRNGSRPIVVVATQTIEVGADFDFHSLFVEAASYAAVKQRVGRLNRLGVRKAARGAIVLVRADSKADALYGATIDATWTLLERHARDGVVDLGIDHAPAPTNETAVRKPVTPELSPSLLSLLVQTNPLPAVEPDVAEYLHGFATQVPDVSVVWREGLTDGSGLLDEARAREILAVLPPLSAEAMSLPYSAFRQWAARWDGGTARKIVDSGDLEGDVSDRDEDAREKISGKVLLVTGNRVQWIAADQVRPGAQIVVPAARGGADDYGWKPEDTAPVSDLALAARNPGLVGDPSKDPGARSARRRELVLVWTPEIARAWVGAGADESMRPLLDVLADPEATLADAGERLHSWLTENEAALPQDVRATFSGLTTRTPEWLEAGDEQFGLVLRDGRVTGEDLVEGRELQRTVPVALDEHLRTVGALAETFARGVGLTESLVAALRVAGATHDLGKADPRFQRRLGAPEGQLLAKSKTYDRSVPRGERHEVYSVAVLDKYPAIFAGVEEHRDLIRYLVGSHHGMGRGMHPITEDSGVCFKVAYEEQELTYDGRPALHAVDSGWVDLFVAQNRKYGPWMLAYLESILRLADHRRSELEVEEYDKRDTHRGADE
jgi:CRISPR-associated endonuclease/helicase Cas3